ncbi:hypothetical protein WN48_05879 [Eufriesea mexicana]|uniref:Uncharacterized protein n=1 Tax=Eufriesea mexicana TaxID=516756 RepID=A0A310SLX0_9HYME|nr:hypothetical protein WN48_05879 [Eufriesea mexicana]
MRSYGTVEARNARNGRVAVAPRIHVVDEYFLHLIELKTVSTILFHGFFPKKAHRISDCVANSCQIKKFL